MTPNLSGAMRQGAARKRFALPFVGATMLGVTLLSSVAAHAVTPIDFAGTYAQDFDTLPSSGAFAFTGKGPFDVPQQDSTVTTNVVSNPLPGFQFQQVAGSGANVNFRFDNGSQTGGSVVSFGATGSAERALGVQPTSSLSIGRIGAIFRNTSQTTYTSATISYNGEQWRNGGNANVTNALQFNYILTSTAPTNIDGAATASASNLDFTAPVNGGASGPSLDGNVAPNRTAVTGNINFAGAGWAPGTFLVIRFDAPRTTSGSSNGLAIDDFSLSASAVAQPTKPTLTNPTAAPAAVEQGKQTLLSVTVTPGTNPTSTGIAVVGDLTVLGGSATQPFFDDGTNGDAAAGDGIYSYLATVSPTAATGTPSIAVRVSDAQNRVDNTFINLTVTQATAPSTTVVISEFRTRGALGASDEFVELYNLSNAAVDISGYTIQYSSGTGSTPSARATVPAGVTLPARQHYLFAATGSGVETQANATFGAFMADSGGIGLVDATGNRVDAVGFSGTATPGTQLKEGTVLPNAPTTNTDNQSYERLPFGVNSRDTQNNVSDFLLTSSNPQPLVPNNLPPTLDSATFSGTINQPFSRQLTGTDPEGAALTYTALTPGVLVPGNPDLTLSPTGVLSGTPSTAGNFPFRAAVSDGANTTAASFLVVISAATDGEAPLLTFNKPASPLTRDQLAATSLTGTATDVAPAGVPPVGVNRVRFQLRRDKDGFAYNGTAFTSNNSIYYFAPLSAATANTAETRTFSRSFSFLPPTLDPGTYSLIVFAADNNNNFRVSITSVTIVAPAAPPFVKPKARPKSSGAVS